MRKYLLLVIAATYVLMHWSFVRGQDFKIAPCDSKATNPFHIAPAEPIRAPRVDDPDTTDYLAMCGEAVRQNRHLVVWVGYACRSSEKQLTGPLHCHVAEGYLQGVSGQCVLVLVPARGDLALRATIPVDEVCAMTVRQGCAGTYQRGGAAAVRAAGG